MNLYRVTFKDGETMHSTTFTAPSRDEAILQFHTWAESNSRFNFEFIACVEVK